MKKMILSLLSIIIIFLFLISCQTETKISDEQLKAELQNMSSDELNVLSKEVDNAALTGQAYSQIKSVKVYPEQIKTLLDAMKYSAKVYSIDEEITPELSLVYLKNLKEDGTLKGNRVQVMNHCSDSKKPPPKNNLPLLQVYSKSNIFIYDPFKDRVKFDQVNVYHYGEFTLDYFTKFAEHIGWSTTESGMKKLTIPFLKIELCDPDINAGQATFLANSQTISVGCYNAVTCLNVGKLFNSQTGVTEIPGVNHNLGIILHEYIHNIYVSIAKDSGISATEKQWNQLNEAYANFIPRAAINSISEVYSSKGEWGDLNNNNQFNFNNNDLLDKNNILAISGALWDVSEEIGGELTNELVIISWKLLSKFKDNPAPVAALIALTDASKQKYGANSETHKNNRDIIITAFASHGIVCENCFPAS